ncbi:MAG: GAF domain-containing protein [Candidatus Wallbacteria bacterium]|nr:GAF domain-containing protein [Candidatus Wallbacteria bacterium]
MLTSAQSSDEDAPGVSAARQDGERLRVQLEVVRILAEAPSVRQAARLVLDAMLGLLDCDVGAIWQVDAETHVLRCVEVRAGDGASATDFETASRSMTFARGVDLPGRVWSSAEVIGLDDISGEENFPRAKAAAATGLVSGIGFPIRSGGEVTGVLEVFGRSADPPDAASLTQLQALAVQFGQFLQGREAEDLLRAKTEVLQTLTDATTVLLQTGDWVKASAALVQGAVSLTESDAGFSATVAEDHLFHITAAHGAVWMCPLGPASCIDAADQFRTKGRATIGRSEGLFGCLTKSLAPRIAGIVPGPDCSCPFVEKPQGAYLGVPVLRSGNLVGVLAVTRRGKGYGWREQARLEHLGSLAGVLDESHRRERESTALQEQLRQSQKMEAVGRLAGGVAHDFNNLLTVILGHLEFAVEAAAGNETLSKDLDVVRNAAGRAEALTRQLLAFSRRQVLRPLVTDLNGIVEETEKILRRLIGEHITLEVRLKPELPKVMVDPGQMGQVLMNLSVNARDAMPDGGLLVITTDTRTDSVRSSNGGQAVQERVTLSVSDTGCGMPPETVARAFEPFFTTKGPGKGTGLGLSMVFGIVNQSGGTIQATSAPGRGTTFEICLPPAPGSGLCAPERPAETCARPGSETILVVEDDEGIRGMVVRGLRRHGYAPVESASGQEALELCRSRKKPFDLVVTDVVMPNMSGPQLVALLLEQAPSTKVLYMSGYTDDSIAGSAAVMSSRAVLLQKPFTTDALVRCVRRVLDGVAEPPAAPDETAAI